MVENPGISARQPETETTETRGSTPLLKRSDEKLCKGYVVPLSAPPDLPTFDGRNVSIFLQLLERKAGRYLQEAPRDVLGWVADRCTPEVLALVAQSRVGPFAPYENQDYEEFRRELLEIYRDREQRYTVADLRSLECGNGPLIRYNRTFLHYLHNLAPNEGLRPREDIHAYLEGLPEDMQERVVRKTSGLRCVEDVMLVAETMSGSVDAEAVQSFRLYKERSQRERGVQMRQPAARTTHAAQISQVANPYETVMRGTVVSDATQRPAYDTGRGEGYQRWNGTQDARVQRPRPEPQPVEESRAERGRGRPGRDMPNERRRDEGRPNAGREERERGMDCFYCGNADHSRAQCPEVERDLAAGIIALSPYGHINLPDGSWLRVTRGKTLQQMALDAAAPRVLKANMTSLELSEIVTLQAGDNEEVVRHKVSLAMSRAGNGGGEKIPEKRERRKKAAKEETKTVVNVEEGANDEPADDIAARILATEVTLPVKTLCSQPRVKRAVKRQLDVLARAGRELRARGQLAKVKEAVLVSDRYGGSSESEDESEGSSDDERSGSDESESCAAVDPDGANHLTVACGTLRVELNGRTLDALVDPGSEINVLSTVEAKKRGLPVKKVSKTTLVGVTGHTATVTGYARRVLCRVGQIVGELSFYIVPDVTQAILGRPFDRAFQAEWSTSPDGKQWGRLFAEGRRTEERVQLTPCRGGDHWCRQLRLQEQWKKLTEVLQTPKTVPPVQNIDEDFEEELRADVTARAVLGNEDYNVFACILVHHAHENKGLTACTLRKRVADKVRPTAAAVPGGRGPDNRADERNSAQPRGVLERQLRRTQRGPLTKEELAKLRFGNDLNEKEVAKLQATLQKHRTALSFGWADLGLLSESIELPVLIKTVPHEPWAQRPMRFSQVEWTALKDIVKERLDHGICEYSDGSYSNRYFLVRKKNGKWRFIQDVRPLNAVAIRDANVPQHMDDLLERLSGYPVYTLLDAFSGYDQIPLALESRDLTALWTPLGLVRMTRLPQGYTNSVAVFERVMSKVLAEARGSVCECLVDDVTVKNETREKDETVDESGCRRYIAEHIANVGVVLGKLATAGLTITAEKAEFCVPEAAVLGTVLSHQGRKMTKDKVAKVLEFPRPATIKELRGFLALVNVNHAYVPHVAEISEPLIEALRGKKVDSRAKVAWTPEREGAFLRLKAELRIGRVLKAPDFERACPFVVYTDAGDSGAGAALMQADEEGGELRVVRFDSKIFNPAQRQYSVPKREVLAVLFALRKFRVYLMYRPFTLRMDSRTAMGMIRNPTAVSDPVTARWIATIAMSQADIEHVPREKNMLADLLGRIAGEEEEPSDEEEYIEAMLSRGAGLASDDLVAVAYSEQDVAILEFLINGEAPGTTAQKKAVQRKARKYCIVDNELHRKAEHGPPRQIVRDKSRQALIVRRLHEEIGHRGIESTFASVARHYYWEQMYAQCTQAVKTCDVCQKVTAKKEKHIYGSRRVQRVFFEAAMDHVLVAGRDSKNRYLIDLRCTFTGWVEAAVVTSTSARHVVDFLDDVFSRHGVIPVIVSDNGHCGAEEVEAYLKARGSQLKHTTAYNPRGNAVIERGHSVLVRTIAKLMLQEKRRMKNILNAALWADRTAVRKSTGLSPYFLVYGRDAPLPIDVAEWEPDLNVALEEQLKHRTLEILNGDLVTREAEQRLSRVRELARDRQNDAATAEEIRPGDEVLLWRSEIERKAGSKIEAKWRGPFSVAETFGSLARVDLGERVKLVSMHNLKRYHRPEGESEAQKFDGITGNQDSEVVFRQGIRRKRSHSPPDIIPRKQTRLHAENEDEVFQNVCFPGDDELQGCREFAESVRYEDLTAQVEEEEQQARRGPGRPKGSKGRKTLACERRAVKEVAATLAEAAAMSAEKHGAMPAGKDEATLTGERATLVEGAGDTERLNRNPGSFAVPARPEEHASQLVVRPGPVLLVWQPDSRLPRWEVREQQY